MTSETLPSSCVDCFKTCSHKQLAATLKSKLDTVTPLNTTLKDYSRHLLLLVPGSDKWPSDINEFPSSSIINKIVSTINSICNSSCKVTFIDHINNTTDQSLNDNFYFSLSSVDAILVPDLVSFNISFDTLDVLGELLSQEIKIGSFQTVPSADSFNDAVITRNISCRSIVLICAHKKRDKRCSVAAEILIDEWNNDPLENVDVYKCSHIGGHKFAGNVVFYADGVLDSYGLVNSCNFMYLAKKVINEKVVIDDLFRGRMKVPLGEW